MNRIVVINNLASLFAPSDEKEFLKHFVSKTRLHVCAADNHRAESILTRETIERLLETDAVPAANLKLVRANRVIPPMMYRDGDDAGRIDPKAVHSMLRQGVALVIDNIDEQVAELARLSDSIERQTGHRVWINVYVSGGRGKAFKPHWDNHDVIVLQVRGSKRWRSFGVVNPPPTRKHREDDPVPTTVAWEGMMNAGDVLYLPRGEVHEAELASGESVHLTIGIKPKRGYDLWAWIGEQARADAVFGADLMRGDDAREHEARLKARMHELIESASVSEFLEGDDANVRPRARAENAAAERIGDNTTIIPTLRRRVAIDLSSASIETVMIGGEKYKLSVDARRVLDFIQKSDAQNVGAIVNALGGQVDAKGIRDAIAELARLGLVGTG